MNEPPRTEAGAWEQLAPILFDERRWAGTPGEVDRLLALLALRPPADVLDLGCGPGRHLLELARRGFHVSGVDATAAFVVAAREASAAERLETEVVHADMREFHRPASFDAVVNLSTSFGYFTDPADDRRVLENVHRSLRAGGALVMELAGKEVVARTLKGPEWREEKGVFLLTEQRPRHDWRWVENRLVFVADSGRQEFVLAHRLYSAAELTSLLAGCGFSSLSVYGGLDGSPYDEHATALVAVGRA